MFRRKLLITFRFIHNNQSKHVNIFLKLALNLNFNKFHYNQ